MAACKRITPISYALVSQYLRYEPESGVLKWIKKPSQRIIIGAQAGCRRDTDRGYIVLGLCGRMYYAHRIAWSLQTQSDVTESVQIDHRNGNTLDNRWSNLRNSTQSQNLANSLHPVGASGVRGVLYDKAKRKWRAQISHKNKCIFLGNFDTIEGAATARRAAEERLQGEFAFDKSRSG